MTSRLRILAGVAAVAVAGCGGSDGSGKADKVPMPDPGGDKARAALEKLDGEVTAKRVSALRKLKFTDGAPKVRIVTPADTTGYIRQQVERAYPTE